MFESLLKKELFITLLTDLYSYLILHNSVLFCFVLHRCCWGVGKGRTKAEGSKGTGRLVQAAWRTSCKDPPSKQVGLTLMFSLESRKGRPGYMQMFGKEGVKRGWSVVLLMI